MTRHAPAPASPRSPSAASSGSKRRHARARAQRGATLLELLIGIGVIIVVMVVVLMGLRSLNGQMDRSALLRQAPQIRANLAGYGSAGALNFATLTTQQANALGAFRPETVSGTGDQIEVQHEFGGRIFASGFDDDFGSVKKGKAFTLSYAGIPKTQCASIARGLALVAEGLWVGDEKTETRLKKPAARVVKTPGVATATAVGDLVAACETSAEEVTIHALMS
ncbi:hypothetical protein PV762_05515 [Mitsuaria sp. CC2]|uniref:hypothetical protein n=1 Tax=Mitsuaria sp. CC2 TaxID=3029186 RepID=UPI003B8AD28F